MKKLSLVILSLILGGIAVAGCGMVMGLNGNYDDTCYDCRSVCEGTSSSVMDSCLSECVDCQGFSKCFTGMDGKFEGMKLSRADWKQVDCQALLTLSSD